MESVVEGLIGNPLVYLFIAGCICGSAVFLALIGVVVVLRRSRRSTVGTTESLAA